MGKTPTIAGKKRSGDAASAAALRSAPKKRPAAKLEVATKCLCCEALLRIDEVPIGDLCQSCDSSRSGLESILQCYGKMTGISSLMHSAKAIHDKGDWSWSQTDSCEKSFSQFLQGLAKANDFAEEVRAGDERIGTRSGVAGGLFHKLLYAVDVGKKGKAHFMDEQKKVLEVSIAALQEMAGGVTGGDWDADLDPAHATWAELSKQAKEKLIDPDIVADLATMRKAMTKDPHLYDARRGLRIPRIRL